MTMFLLCKLTRSSHFFVSEVGMVSKCLSRQAPWPAVSWCLQSPAQPAAVCTAALGPQTAVVCSAAVRGGGGDRAPQSLSPQLTKMCHFIIISGCQQCSLAPTLAWCISAPEFGDLTHKNHPQRQPGPADHLHSPKDQRWLKLRPLCL